ncbi:ornithine cyclodeaminase family protein [Candidatus Woesearchaeota archaeon]|nr:ornithine cyclodeaminase family protein [Candidatus Woesearchaeota archaeon]
MTRIITEEQVKKTLDEHLPEAFVAIENAYHLFSEGKAKTSFSEIVMDSGSHFSFMCQGPNDYYIVKEASVFPGNPKEHGLPSVHPNILVYGNETSSKPGKLQTVIEGEYFAAIRTALSSAVGAKYLAVEKPRKLALLGSGVEAASHAHVFAELFPSLEEIAVYSPNKEHREKFAADRQYFKEEYGVEVKAYNEPESAVRDAEMVACVSTSKHPILEHAWLSKDMYIAAVGSMGPNNQEVPDETMKRSLIVVDSKKQMHTYGEIHGPQSRGSQLHTQELGNIIAEGILHRPGQNVCKFHGLAATDFKLAEIVQKY